MFLGSLAPHRESYVGHSNTVIPPKHRRFLALLFGCAWVSFIVWKTGALPGLEGLALFIASLYGLGKAGETLQRVLKK